MLQAQSFTAPPASPSPAQAKKQAVDDSVVAEVAAILDDLDTEASAAMYRPLVLTFLGDEGMAMIRAVTSTDRRLPFHLVSLLEDIIGPGSSLPVAQTAVSEIVAMAPSPDTIFRNNDVETTIVCAFCSVEGHRFLVEVLATPTSRIVTEANEWREDHFTRCYLTVAQQILTNIAQSASRLPHGLKALMAEVAELVSHKFPGTQLHVVGVLFFLRFICPALVTPERNRIVPVKPGSEAQRALILIAKVFQALCCDLRFDEAHGHAALLNRFIDDNQPVIHRFFGYVMSSREAMGEKASDDLDGMPTDGAPTDGVHGKDAGETFKQRLTYVHSWLIQNLEAVGTALMQCDGSGSVTEQSKAVFSRLHVVLSELAPDLPSEKKAQAR